MHLPFVRPAVPVCVCVCLLCRKVYSTSLTPNTSTVRVRMVLQCLLSIKPGQLLVLVVLLVHAATKPKTLLHRESDRIWGGFLVQGANELSGLPFSFIFLKHEKRVKKLSQTDILLALFFSLPGGRECSG